jgi:hypothetical protein
LHKWEHFTLFLPIVFLFFCGKQYCLSVEKRAKIAISCDFALDLGLQTSASPPCQTCCPTPVFDQSFWKHGSYLQCFATGLPIPPTQRNLFHELTFN